MLAASPSGELVILGEFDACLKKLFVQPETIVDCVVALDYLILYQHHTIASTIHDGHLVLRNPPTMVLW